MREKIDSLGTVSEALVAIRDNYGLSHVTYHLGQTILSSIDAPFVRTTYPDSWVARYLLNGYVHIDPVAREGFGRSAPFDWSEVQLAEEQAAFLADANQFGVGSCGYSVPIADEANRNALMSFNSALPKANWTTLAARLREEWVGITVSVHRIAMRELHGEPDPTPLLSRREAESLNWVARGKDHRDIGALLGISEHTARHYTKLARIKLGCSTLSSAVARATQLRLITPWEARDLLSS